MEKEILVKSVKLIKSGMSNNRKWNLYEVIDANGEKYTTFDNSLINLIDKEVNVEVEEEQREFNGRMTTRRTIRKVVEKDDKKDKKDDSMFKDDVMVALLKIENVLLDVKAKVDRIDDYVSKQKINSGFEELGI